MYWSIPCPSILILGKDMFARGCMTVDTYVVSIIDDYLIAKAYCSFHFASIQNSQNKCGRRDSKILTHRQTDSVNEGRNRLLRGSCLTLPKCATSSSLASSARLPSITDQRHSSRRPGSQQPPSSRLFSHPQVHVEVPSNQLHAHIGA